MNETHDPHFLPMTDVTVRWLSDAARVTRFPFALVHREQLVTVVDESAWSTGDSARTELAVPDAGACYGLPNSGLELAVAPHFPACRRPSSRGTLGLAMRNPRLPSHPRRDTAKGAAAGVGKRRARATRESHALGLGTGTRAIKAATDDYVALFMAKESGRNRVVAV